MAARVDLGERRVEVGPGRGASTDWLRHKVQRLTVVETDDEAARILATRFADTNVEVVHGDATKLTLHQFHEGDTYNPIEPTSLLGRLQTLGYDHITIRVGNTLTFVAHKPAVSS